MKAVCILGLFIYIFVYNGHAQTRIPRKCNMFYIRDEPFCCVFPPFFRYDIAIACGSFGLPVSIDQPTNVGFFKRNTGRHGHFIEDKCSYWLCILRTYKLINENYVDEELYYLHLDKWVKNNPEFAPAMTSAKLHCSKLIPLPMGYCDFADLNECIRTRITADCPVFSEEPRCAKSKAFWEECREYYLEDIGTKRRRR